MAHLAGRQTGALTPYIVTAMSFLVELDISASIAAFDH
jgi:hypothetical protein